MRDAERPVLHLIDGSGYIYRAYHALGGMWMRDGTPTNAVVGFAKMLNKLLRADKPTALGMAFDTGNKNFRHAIYPDYKANREAPPEDLTPQFPLIHALVEAMDIPILQLDGYEADDILATLARKAVAAGYDVVIVSGDKDLMQLVDDHVCIFDPMKDQTFRYEDVVTRFFVPPDQVADILALAGDSSDNIPGVRSVGPVSAAKMVIAYGDVEAVIAGLTAKRGRKAYEDAVLKHADLARLSKKLTVLAYDAPIALEIEPLLYTAPDKNKLGDFLRRIEARGLLREFGIEPDDAATMSPGEQTQGGIDNGAKGTAGKPPPPWEVNPYRNPQADLFKEPPKVSPVNPALAHYDSSVLAAIRCSNSKTILTKEALTDLINALRRWDYFSVDLETTSLQANAADIVGIALCGPDELGVYIPVGHRYLGVPKQLPLDEVLEALRPILEDPKIIKYGQNIKYDFVVFRRAGIHLAGIGHDAMLAAYVLDPARTSYGLDALAHDFLMHDTITYAAVTGKGKNQIAFAEVPIEAATVYASEDAVVALRLAGRFVKELHMRGIEALYHRLEIPLVPVLATMEAHGVMVDKAHLDRLAKEFNARLIDIQNAAYAEIGEPINLGSPKQLSKLFFEKLGYPVVKKTKTGYSTDQEVLETLARTYTLPKIILEHRLLTKLKSTYVDSLPKMINPETGRLHTRFNQTGTATGRLSSSDPNLQNIPIRGDDGRRIRAAFTAPEGCEIISADYSQVELRVMAHLSGDPHFIEAFHNNEDIHRRTAMEILTGGAEPSKEMRRRAKAINFGILYGLSEFGLSRQLNIPRAEAHAYIAAYFSRYSSIRAFLDKTIADGREYGFVSTLMGRRRHLPDLRSKNGNLRQAAERIAMNTPVQGTAADLIKLAMIKVAARLNKEQRRARLVLQVHDELVLESPFAEREAITTLLKEEMSNVAPLRVPIVVDVGHGPNWAEAH